MISLRFHIISRDFTWFPEWINPRGYSLCEKVYTWFPDHIISRDYLGISRDFPWFHMISLGFHVISQSNFTDFPKISLISQRFHWFPKDFTVISDEVYTWFPKWITLRGYALWKSVNMISRPHDFTWFPWDFPWFPKDFTVISKWKHDFPSKSTLGVIHCVKKCTHDFPTTLFHVIIPWDFTWFPMISLGFHVISLISQGFHSDFWWSVHIWFKVIRETRLAHATLPLQEIACNGRQWRMHSSRMMHG